MEMMRVFVGNVNMSVVIAICVNMATHRVINEAVLKRFLLSSRFDRFSIRRRFVDETM